MSSAGVFLSVLWAMMVNALCILPSFLVGALSEPIREDLALTDELAGYAFSGFWLVASICAFPCARIVARIGTDGGLRVASLITVVLCAAIAVFGFAELSFVILLVLAGAATAFATPAVNVRVMAVVPPGRQAFAITAAGASPVLSLMAAGLVAGVLGQVVDWRWIFAGVVAVMVLLNIAHPKYVHPPAQVSPRTGTAKTAPALRPLVRVMILVGLANIGVGAATSFLVLAAPEARVEPSVAALAVGVGSAVSVGARLLLAALVDKRRNDSFPLVVLLMTLGALGFILVGLAEPWAFIVGLVLILVPGWSWVGLLLFGVLARYREAVASASGVVQMVFFVAGVAGPLGMGLALSYLPYAWAWWIFGACMLVAAVAVWSARTTLPGFDSGVTRANEGAG